MKKRLTIITGAVLATTILFFLLRGPYLSNYTKRLIIPVLEHAIKERVIIDKAVINLFPFYIQAKGLKVFDKDGNRLLQVSKGRAYIDLPGLLSNEIRIRKLTINKPDVSAYEGDIRRIIENIKESAKDRDNKYRLSIGNIELTNGIFNIRNNKGWSVSGTGMFFEMTAKTGITGRLLAQEGALKSPGLPDEIRGSIGVTMKVTDDSIDITELDIKSLKSFLSASGQVQFTPEWELKGGGLSGKAGIHAEVFRRFFDLKTKKDGMLSFAGSVDMTLDNVSKKPRFAVDLKTDSRFHLETLMEIIKVDEDISGELSVKGEIKGIFPELSGNGTAQLRDAVLGGLRIDSLSGEAGYGENKFTLNNFNARTYEGTVKGKASISLPHGDYIIDADVSRINSLKFFRVIEWEPPFPSGNVNGHFRLTQNHGEEIEVAADLNYKNTTAKAGDLIGRLDAIKCRLHLKDNILQLDDTVLSTPASALLLDGSIDLGNKTMSLEVQLDSGDISDLTAPYYVKLIAPLKFKGRAAGPLKDPEISGALKAGPGSIHGLKFARASADLVYRIRSLSAPRINITDGKSSYDAAGTIEFRKADGLFSFKDPFYRAGGTVKDAGIKPFVTVLYRDIPVSGSASGSVSFEGDSGNYTARGDITVRDSVIYGQGFDKVTVKTVLRQGRMEFHPVTAQKGDSHIEAKGGLSFDGGFDLSVSSDKINLPDIDMLRDLSPGGSAGLHIHGGGTFSKPDIRFTVNIREAAFRNMGTGKGVIEGSLKGKDLSASGTFMNGLITADAKAALSSNTRWDIDINMKKGNYDSLLSGFMKSPPEDLSFSLEGKIGLKGEGRRVSMTSRVGYLSCAAYGYNLRNKGDIIIELEDRKFAIKSFILAGDHAKLSARGALTPDNRLEVEVAGNLNLAPLKILSDKFASLRGQGDFTIDVRGPRESPDVSGEITVHDFVASLMEYPYKVGPVNGTVFLKEDRFTFDSVKTAFGSGSITMSGVGYLKGLSVKRLFLSSTLEGIKIRPMEKVSATADGRFFYERSVKGSALSGDIFIKKARYEKDIEWNKWLINLREIDRETVRYPAFLKDTELNVHIFGEDNIVIDNNLAKAPVKIALTLTGNISRPGLVGRIESLEGTIYFRSNEFKILEGSSADFVNPNRITPVIHLLAETYTGEYYIKLNLDGTIDKFTLALFSDPPLNEMEILNLLTFGQTKKDFRGIESGIAASEAVSILTGGLQDVVQEKFRSITGFEHFRIEPGTTSTGAVAPKITIGKRLLEDKLSVIYSTSVGTTEENVIRLEYRVDKNISLIGSRDELGSVGGDVKFRFEFK